MNMWVPFEGHLTNVLQFSTHIVLLFQMKDANTLEKRFAVHTVDRKKLEEDTYPGEPLDELLSFSDDLAKVRIVKKNENEFVVVSLGRVKGNISKLTTQTVNVQEKKLVGQQNLELKI